MAKPTDPLLVVHVTKQSIPPLPASRIGNAYVFNNKHASPLALLAKIKFDLNLLGARRCEASETFNSGRVALYIVLPLLSCKTHLLNNQLKQSFSPTFQKTKSCLSCNGVLLSRLTCINSLTLKSRKFANM
jgi:hypothetical protein